MAFVQAGLKTGMYYLRTRAAADAIKFTVDQQALAKNKAARAAKLSNGAAGIATPLKVCLSPFSSPLADLPLQQFRLQIPPLTAPSKI